MSRQATKAAWRQELPRMPGVARSTAKLVLLALADYAHIFGCGIYPSVRALCRDTGLSRRQMVYVLDALEDVGLLEIVVPATNRRQAEYRFTFLDAAFLAAELPGGADTARLGCSACTSRGAAAAPRTVLEPAENQTVSPPKSSADRKAAAMAARKIKLELRAKIAADAAKPRAAKSSRRRAAVT